MAKKVDVSFMRFVLSDEEWVREVKEPRGALLGALELCNTKPPTRVTCTLLIMRPGGAVVDVYNKSFGPTEMLATHFQNFFFDLGEKVSLRFVRAERDKVRALRAREMAERSRSSVHAYLLGVRGRDFWCGRWRAATGSASPKGSCFALAAAQD